MTQTTPEYVPSFMQELKYPDGTINSLTAIKKFHTYIEQVSAGKLLADNIKDWNYYRERYLIPFKQSCFKPFLDVIFDTIVHPKTRLVLLGDLLYFADYILQSKEPEYINYAATRALEVIQWVYYRVLYQQLLADYATSQGLQVDITKLSQQLDKFHKVLTRWNQPKPSKSTPHIMPPPVFDPTILASINQTRSELLCDYNSRLRNQQNRIRDANNNNNNVNGQGQYYSTDQYGQQQYDQMYSNNGQGHGQGQGYNQNNGGYQSDHSHSVEPEQWNYGGYTDDLIESLHEEILGAKFSVKKAPQTEAEHRQQQQEAIMYVQRFPVQPPPCYTSDQFRLFQPSVYEALCKPPNSTTCTTCGMMFWESESELFKHHIKWHINRAQAKRDMKEGLDKSTFEKRARLWCFDSTDFVHFRQSEDHGQYTLDNIREQTRQTQLYRQAMQNGPVMFPDIHDTGSGEVQQAILSSADLEALSADDRNLLHGSDDEDDGRKPITNLHFHINADDNEDGSSNSVNQANLPFYDPRDGFSSLEQVRYPRPENYRANADPICAICHDAFQTVYNSTRDSWVIQNCSYLTADLILQGCLSFLRRKILQDGLKSGGTVNFTELQRIELTKRLESFVAKKSQGTQNKLVHYSPCFENILRDSVKYAL